MIAVVVTQVGLALVALGSLLVPARPFDLVAGGLLAVGAALAAAGLLLPARPFRLAGPAMELDDVVPVYEFGEDHALQVRAPLERVDRAIREVSAAEIRLFRTLTLLRAPFERAAGRPSILNPPPRRPILEVALRTGFVALRDRPGRELVFGMLVCGAPEAPLDPPAFEAFAPDSHAKAVMNFHLEPAAGGVMLRTQTRIHATGRCRRRFAVYWRLIYPGSALIRRQWLRAIRKRAEAG
jgi:hypothetical protein